MTANFDRPGAGPRRNAAADNYTDPALSFRDYFGARIIERLALKPGAHVLDVCCGAGAVAIPAATAVGRRGRVTAVDHEHGLLREGSRRAAEAHLPNIAWKECEIDALSFKPESFDAVVCAFGIHQARDITATTGKLWQLVRPGGKLLVATWAERLFEPANQAFWQAVRAVRPSLYRGGNAWDAVDKPEALAEVLAAAGVPGGSVSEEPYEHPLLRPEDWWTIVLGSHYREVVDELTPLERELVETLTVKPLADKRIEWINATGLFATARK